MVNNININTTEIVAFTNKLEKIHRAALPNAVRSTLNDLAFDVKSNTLQSVTNSTFIKRKPSFFRAFSRVDRAVGFNIKTMVSSVGMRKDTATEGMDSQEKGGSEKRALIATDKARAGKNPKKLVTKRNKFRGKNIVKANGRSKQAFLRAAYWGYKKYGKGVIIRTYNGMFRINNIRKNQGIKTERIWSFKKNRSVSVKATRFMEKSALKSTSKMPSIFTKNAQFQIKKWTR